MFDFQTVRGTQKQMKQMQSISSDFWAVIAFLFDSLPSDTKEKDEIF